MNLFLSLPIHMGKNIGKNIFHLEILDQCISKMYCLWWTVLMHKEIGTFFS